MTRLGYTAELGYELWVDRDRALELWDALVEATEPQGMKVIGMAALDLFRIEGGFIIGGVEYDPTVSPVRDAVSAGRSRSTRASSRDATASSVTATRPTLRLTSVVLESGGDDASGAPLSVDGAEVGVRHAGDRLAVPRRQDARARQGAQGADAKRGHEGDGTRRRTTPSPARSSVIRCTTRSASGRRRPRKGRPCARARRCRRRRRRPFSRAPASS